MTFSSSLLLHSKLMNNAAPPLPLPTNTILHSSSSSSPPLLLLRLRLPVGTRTLRVRASSGQSIPPSSLPHPHSSPQIQPNASHLPLQHHRRSSFSQSTLSSQLHNDAGSGNDAGNVPGGGGAGDGDQGNGNGNGKGKGGGRGDDDGKDENADDEFGPLLTFEEVMRETEAQGVSLPPDMLDAAQNGGIQKLLLLRYFEMQVRSMFQANTISMLLQQNATDMSFLSCSLC